MATIKSTLALYDGMTGPIRKIHNAMNSLIDAFENVQDVSSNAIDTAALQRAREELTKAGHEMDQMEQNLRDAADA